MPDKIVLLLLNKIDLVPKEVLEKVITNQFLQYSIHITYIINIYNYTEYIIIIRL